MEGVDCHHRMGAESADSALFQAWQLRPMNSIAATTNLWASGIISSIHEWGYVPRGQASISTAFAGDTALADEHTVMNARVFQGLPASRSDSCSLCVLAESYFLHSLFSCLTVQ